MLCSCDAIFLDPGFIMFKNPTYADQALPWTSRGSPEFDFWILTFEEDLVTWTFSVYIICF